MLVSIGHVVQEKEEQYEQKLSSLRSNQLPSFSNIIASGKRKEVIGVVNAMYEAGLLDNTITKAELFERMAVVFGDPGLKEYATALSQIMQTYKYEGIFENLTEVAKQQRDNSDKK